MDKEKVLQWLRGVEDKGDLFTRFSTYGDDDNGTVWFEYIGQHAWSHSCYDTRELALNTSGAQTAAALGHMTNYLTLLIAAQLQGNTPA